jgi:hypothetical protein
VGTKVLLAHDGGDWVRKCLSARGMSRHESDVPLKGMLYPSFVDTLTCVKLLVMCVESVLPQCPNNSQ